MRSHATGWPMGRVGAAGDNATMESFFALLQHNVLDRHTWHTRDELRIAIVTWIERTYHRRRRQAALGHRAVSVDQPWVRTPPRLFQPGPDRAPHRMDRAIGRHNLGSSGRPSVQPQASGNRTGVR